MGQTDKKIQGRGRPTKTEGQLAALRSLGLFTAEAARVAGIPKKSLSRLLEAGAIERLDYGLYKHPDADIDHATEDFIVACAKFGPKAAIGGLTALFHYNLTDQAPSRVWVLVPPSKWSRDTKYRCLRVKTSLEIGIVDEKTYRMASVERALAEGLQFATKIGLQTAVAAARNAFRERLTTPEKVLKTAQELQIEQYVIRNWEAITIA